MGDDWLCSTPHFEAIRGQTIHSSYCRVVSLEITYGKPEEAQRESNHWQTQAIEAQTIASYWKNKHFVVFEELVKCRRSRGQWKRKAEAKEVQCQEVLEDKIVL